MKFLKNMFPAPAKTLGFVAITVLGLLAYNVINRKYNIESKTANALPGGQRMKPAA